MKNNKRIAKIICSLCLWSLVLLCIVPFIWMVSASFKREADVSYRITCNNGNQRTLINP